MTAVALVNLASAAMPEKFYITTPIYYVNARPHIGHAYTTIAADTLARRKRIDGADTYFLTGTDEHGQKIGRSAAAAGIEPQQFADDVSASFRSLWHRMGITYDQYIRTTDAKHKRGVQKLFTALYQRGHIYLDSYTGQYSVGEEMFVEGPPGTIGPDGKPTETITEENFYFRLSSFQKPLIDLIESNQLTITPEARKNEVLSFLRGNVNDGSETLLSDTGVAYVPGAVKDLSVSRTSFDWGIPVPDIAASETSQKHVIYVWLDALANYMTAVGYGDDTEDGAEMFARFWPADLHFVGKEIVRFHCVYWPAFLLAAGLPLPKKIVAHGWLLFEESKMSKSRGNIVRTETILDAFGSLKPDTEKYEQDLFGADVLRYFLLREIPFGQDGSFSFDALVARYNSDLANGYGNLVSRTLNMIAQNFESVIPESGLTTELTAATAEAIDSVRGALERQEFTAAVSATSALVAATDQYLTANAPWKLAKDPAQRERLAEVLRTAAKSIRIITALLHPVLPYATARVWEQLGLGSIERAAELGELRDLSRGGFAANTRLGTIAPIFPRAEKELITRMNDAEQKPAAIDPNAPQNLAEGEQPLTPIADGTPTASPRAEAAPATEIAAVDPKVATKPDTPEITIDDFIKVDLRVAKVLVAERIPKADKLLRLEVDLGYEKRQILAGIAQFYEPEKLVGRKVVIVANLAPRKLRGYESQGMVVAASVGDGTPALASFLEDIEIGARLR
ncbi:methionyl-tRNA synthetase [Terriglobus roseus]|uniref:Methionine--tRNA ligase n=2 Tax=Terriglobus roseus TaxID=392734 RepID=A0A1H4SYG3_9BACT|nr:methionyl-tRNA synthetase [Terriglobus roseus]